MSVKLLSDATVAKTRREVERIVMRGVPLNLAKAKKAMSQFYRNELVLHKEPKIVLGTSRADIDPADYSWYSFIDDDTYDFATHIGRLMEQLGIHTYGIDNITDDWMMDDYRSKERSIHLRLLKSGAMMFALCNRDEESKAYIFPWPRMKFDAQWRPHCADGWAMNFLGQKMYFWHGIHVDEDTILKPKKITRLVLLSETNTERRRAMCEIIGWDRAFRLLKGVVVDRDECLGLKRRLLKIRIAKGGSGWASDETWATVLVMENGTIEHGARRRFVEMVSNDVDTCHEAMAWQIGVDTDVYDEGVRT